MKLNNKYYILRHGEALSNKKDIISCWPEKGRFPLTQKGREQIKTAAKKLKNKKINLIFSSDLLRTKQSAEIASKTLKIKIRFDRRLREYNLGIYNGKPIEEFRKKIPLKKRFRNEPAEGETYTDIRKRIYNFLKEINKKYSHKNILIVSHEVPLTMLEAKIKGFSNQEILKKYPEVKRIKNGELRQLKP